MSTPPLNPVSFRLPFNLEGKTHPDVVNAIRWLTSGLVDINQAIPHLKSQLDALGTSTTSTTVVNESTSGGGGSVFPFPGLGTVNDQIGVTAYTTQASDNGAKIIVGDASPIAITLNAGVSTPWFCIIDNDSSAVANLSASSGVVNGETVIQPNGFGIVYFDGTNFWVGATAAATGIVSQVILSIDGGSSTPGTPIVRNVQVPFSGTIIGWSISNCDTTGSLTAEVDKKASSPPPAAPAVPNTTTDKISASAPITLSAAQSASGGAAAVSTWTTTAVAQWDVVQFNVTAMSGITRANIALTIQRS